MSVVQMGSLSDFDDEIKGLSFLALVPLCANLSNLPMLRKNLQKDKAS